MPATVQQKRTSEQKSPGEKMGIAHKRKKAQLYAASQLVVIPAQILPFRSYSPDSARSSESKKTSKPI